MVQTMDERRPDDSDFGFPPPKTTERVLSLWATYYYVHTAHSVEGGLPLLNECGTELGYEVDAEPGCESGAKAGPKLSVRDFCLAAVEGTVRVIGSAGKATVYNYAGLGLHPQCDCSPIVPGLPPERREALGWTLWEVSRGPYGTGEDGMALVPYRSIAVD